MSLRMIMTVLLAAVATGTMVACPGETPAPVANQDPPKETESGAGETAADDGAAKKDPAAEDTPEARGRALLTKVVEACGGETLEAVTALSWKAVQSQVVAQTGGKVDSNVHGRVSFPKSMRQDVSNQTGSASHCLHGEKGWSESRGQVQGWDAQRVASWRQSLGLSTLPLLIDHKSLQVKEVEGLEQADGTYRGISVTRPGMGEVTFYINPKTFRVHRRKNNIVTGVGTIVSREEKLWDYRKVDGVWLPFSRTIEQDGRTTAIISVSEYKLNEKFVADLFDMPKAKTP